MCLAYHLENRNPITESYLFFLFSGPPDGDNDLSWHGAVWSANYRASGRERTHGCHPPRSDGRISSEFFG